MEEDKRLLTSLLEKIDSLTKRIDLIDVRLTRIETEKDVNIAGEFGKAPPAKSPASLKADPIQKPIEKDPHQSEPETECVMKGMPSHVTPTYNHKQDKLKRDADEDFVSEKTKEGELRKGPPLEEITSAKGTNLSDQTVKTDKGFFDRFKGKSLADLEIMFGGNLLNKLGVVIFILGVVFLMAWARKYFSLGKAGKIILGYIISLSMIGGGIWSEKKENYIYYGHGLIAGGWALLYFITFAIFNIKAIQIFHNPLWCTVLLTIIAVGMISHSLTYKNEALTIICYCLGFVTLILITVNTLSLIGTAILAISLIVVCTKLKWDHLNLLGVIACYLIWGYWFSKTGNFVGSAFPLGASILSFYWLTFFLPFHISPHQELKTKADGLVIALQIANTAAFILCFSLLMDRIYPQYLYIFWTIAGIFYIASAAWIRARDIPLFFYINGTVASILFMIAVPNRLDGMKITFGWIIVSQMIYFLGLRLKESYFRFLGFLFLMVPCMKIFIKDMYRLNKIPVFNGILSWRVFVVTFFICAGFLMAATTKRILVHNDEQES
jgi:uncharacterized membrane protein